MTRLSQTGEFEEDRLQVQDHIGGERSGAEEVERGFVDSPKSLIVKEVSRAPTGYSFVVGRARTEVRHSGAQRSDGR